MDIDRTEAMDKFDDFLFFMDEELDGLESDALKHGITLNLNIQSVDELEKLFSLMSNELNKNQIQNLVVLFAKYLGEIVRINFGGVWQLPLEDPKNVYFNTPVIVGHSKVKVLEFSPIHAMRGFAVQRKVGMLKIAVNNSVNPTPLKLDDLLEEKVL